MRAINLNEKMLNDLPARYLMALRAHLAEGSPLTIVSARELGRQALEIGLETLGLAKIHETALAALISPESSSAMREDMSIRATDFFTEAITPIEKTHDAALKTARQLQEATATLEQRTSELADSEINLHEQISSRQSAETALNASEQTSRQLLDDSLLLEKHLHELARKLLSSNEEERRKLSLHLQDDIAQTLLGIHVRLLALKKLATVSNANLDQEIANIQRLVQESTHITNRLSREFAV